MAHPSGELMDATTARLVEFAQRAEFAVLAPDTVHACKRRLIDAFACAVGAFDEPLCRRAREVARRSAGVHEATVWGCDWKTTADAAAFANGVAQRYHDMMDAHLSKTRAHPSDTIAAVLAVAELVGADGPSVVNAVALAYDVFCSFCDAVDVHARGWDQPVCGVIACALAAAKLLQLSPEQTVHAVSLALAPNMPLFRTRVGELSHWKGCAAANGSRNAVFAALLARDGFTGPGRIFEGKHGLWDVVGEFDWQLPPVTGAPPGVTRPHMKYFPVAYHAQPVAWGALELRERAAVEDLAEVHIETYRLAVEMAASPSAWNPGTRETAVHSLPYTLAVALLDGGITSESFTEARLADPQVAALMRQVRVSETPAMSAQYPAAAPCRIEARLKNGGSVTVEITYPKGHAENPLSDDEVATKFRDAFRRRGDVHRCEPALHALWTLDRARDIGDVLKRFETEGGPPFA